MHTPRTASVSLAPMPAALRQPPKTGAISGLENLQTILAERHIARNERSNRYESLAKRLNHHAHDPDLRNFVDGLHEGFDLK